MKSVLTEDDAVSPVIGVILMVAITVIVAAVAGAFVLGITGQQTTAPQGAWDVEAFDTTDNGTTDEVRFRYETGDRLDREDLAVSIPENTTALGSGSVSAGTTIVVDLDDASARPGGDDLQVLWSDEGSDESAVIVRHTFTSDRGHDLDAVTVG